MAKRTRNPYKSSLFVVRIEGRKFTPLVAVGCGIALSGSESKYQILSRLSACQGRGLVKVMGESMNTPSP
ncbi:MULTISPECIES: hypothetical protein [unclassified Microcoleus]|uniref:hypothetical protein n=1 Tax=unclassified Microcoleus TaxID=2642155 RepID=UPI002FD44882